MIQWWQFELPALTQDVDPREPQLQVAAYLDRYLDGEHILIKTKDSDTGEGLRLMRPPVGGVWEMCISDIRIFGWFRCRDVFIASGATTAAAVKGRGNFGPLYAGFRDEARTCRVRLGLTQPDHVTGVDYIDVLSDRH